jgi:hypothetical protein
MFYTYKVIKKVVDIIGFNFLNHYCHFYITSYKALGHYSLDNVIKIIIPITLNTHCYDKISCFRL